MHLSVCVCVTVLEVQISFRWEQPRIASRERCYILTQCANAYWCLTDGFTVFLLDHDYDLKPDFWCSCESYLKSTKARSSWREAISAGGGCPALGKACLTWDVAAVHIWEEASNII